MVSLPSAEVLAKVVSAVTTTMLGLKFSPVRGSATLVGGWRSAALPIPGQRPFVVAISSDEQGCAELSAAMFSCPADSVDASMVNDSLCELVNMTAGHIKSSLAPKQILGVPKVMNADELMGEEKHRGWMHVKMQAGAVELVASISERPHVLQAFERAQP